MSGKRPFTQHTIHYFCRRRVEQCYFRCRTAVHTECDTIQYFQVKNFHCPTLLSLYFFIAQSDSYILAHDNACPIFTCDTFIRQHECRRRSEQPLDTHVVSHRILCGLNSPKPKMLVYTWYS